MSVRIGENTLGQERDCEILPTGVKKCAPPPQFIEIESKIIHQNYKYNKQEYDIALLRLCSPVSLTNKNYVNTICLPITKDLQKQQDQSRFIVAGWGQTEKRTWPKALMKAVVPRRSIDFCRDFFPNAGIADNLICAGGENGVDTCLGDSGGPLFSAALVHSGSRYIQYGITHNGHPSCDEKQQGKTPPSMYTNIADHMDWIRSFIY